MRGELCPVLEPREEKLTFVIVQDDKIDFFAFGLHLNFLIVVLVRVKNSLPQHKVSGILGCSRSNNYKIDQVRKKQ